MKGIEATEVVERPLGRKRLGDLRVEPVEGIVDLQAQLPAGIFVAASRTARA